MPGDRRRRAIALPASDTSWRPTFDPPTTQTSRPSGADRRSPNQHPMPPASAPCETQRNWVWPVTCLRPSWASAAAALVRGGPMGPADVGPLARALWSSPCSALSASGSRGDSDRACKAPGKTDWKRLHPPVGPCRSEGWVQATRRARVTRHRRAPSHPAGDVRSDRGVPGRACSGSRSHGASPCVRTRADARPPPGSTDPRQRRARRPTLAW